MDEGLWPYLLGGLGVAIGLAGGIFGTRASLKHTTSEAERRLIWSFTVVILLLVGLLMAGVVLLPSPYGSLIWIPYGIVLIVSVRFVNRRQAELRELEASPKA